MSLQDWLRNGWLVEHATGPQEIAEVLAVVDRDLKDCKARGLSADWRMSIAYNAALQAATAALAAAGFRPRRAKPTISGRSSPWRLRSAWTSRKSRSSTSSARSATRAAMNAPARSPTRKPTEMAQFARKLRGKVAEWLRANHPETDEAVTRRTTGPSAFAQLHRLKPAAKTKGENRQRSVAGVHNRSCFLWYPLRNPNRSLPMAHVIINLFHSFFPYLQCPSWDHTSPSCEVTNAALVRSEGFLSTIP